MKKAYYLKTCSTCKQILKELDWKGESQDIRSQKITATQLEEMAKLAGSYETLFSRRATKYKSMGLKERVLEEKDYKKLILEEDTFLKRPVFIIEDEIYVGNSKTVVNAIKQKLKN